MAEPLRTIVNFKESCVDPLAKLVLLEAMSFAVEKAESRLEALGKIFPNLESLGEPIIQDIKDIRFSIENLNVCSVSGPATLGGGAGLPPSAPPPAAAIKQLPKREQELVKQMPESLQTALLMELERKPGESMKEPDFFVKGNPVSATKQQKKAAEKTEEEKKERTLPTAWGPLEYKGLSYTSPGYFLSQLHGGDVEKIRGKGNYIKQLDAEGFEVFVGDKLIPPGLNKEDIEKLKGVGMRIQLKKGVIKPTPSGGKPVGKDISAYPTPWTIVQTHSGELLYIEDDKKTTIPENVWHGFGSKELDKLAPNTRQVEGRPAVGESTIPGYSK
jgi:hypothetical protein